MLTVSEIMWIVILGALKLAIIVGIGLLSWNLVFNQRTIWFWHMRRGRTNLWNAINERRQEVVCRIPHRRASESGSNDSTLSSS